MSSFMGGFINGFLEFMIIVIVFTALEISDVT